MVMMANKAINENVKMGVVLEVNSGCILDKNVAGKKALPSVLLFRHMALSLLLNSDTLYACVP